LGSHLHSAKNFLGKICGQQKTLEFVEGFLFVVGVPGVAPGSYPPQGQILLVYYTPLQSFFLSQGFDAFCAGFHSFARSQSRPLQIGTFFLFYRGIIFSTEFYQSPGKGITLAAYGTGLCHIITLIRNFKFYQ